MNISAKDVKSLRERTGAGMMDCKKALAESSGDMEAAVDFLRTKGLAKAAKKASRVAAEGIIGVGVEGAKGILVEVNCETDFVAKGDDFKGFVDRVTGYALKEFPATLEELKGCSEGWATELTLKCGEKIDVRRYQRVVVDGCGFVGHYSHGGKIGVLIALETGADVSTRPEAAELAKDLAMHIAAADPKFVKGDDIDEDFKKREASIYEAQLREEGKPEQMISKIIVGKLNKMAKEVCLLEQKFIKDSDISVKDYIASRAKDLGTTVRVVSMFRLNLGEGVEKKQDNLADEVAKMTSATK